VHGERVAFLGLGVMGRNMAARLVKAGHEVRVWNRTLERAQEFVAAHAAARADRCCSRQRRPLSCVCASATMSTCAKSSPARKAPSRPWRRGRR